jgi:hypothetical protein
MVPMRSPLLSVAAVALLAFPAAGSAQSRALVPAQTPKETSSDKPKDTMPPQMMPPVGKCRIWVEGVPPSRQPAPTDCATALRQKPANGTVIYGPPARDAGNARFQAAPARDARTQAPAATPETKKTPPVVKRTPE